MLWWAADFVAAPASLPSDVELIRKVLIRFGDENTLSFGVVVASGGFVMVANSVANARVATGTLDDGSTVRFRVVSRDGLSGLALLSPEVPSSVLNRTPTVKLADATGVLDQSLFALTPRGHQLLSSGSKVSIGIVQPANRFVPLTEFSLEKPDDRIGGALVFNVKGELAGVVQASLEPALRPTLDVNSRDVAAKSFGPRGLTVAYSVSPSVLSRVVKGFRSADRAVRHPSIGIQMGSAVGGGVRVASVNVQSPADMAGLLANDVIIEADDQRVSDPLQMALVMNDWSPGQLVVLTVNRPGRSMPLKLRVTVGVYQDSSANKVF